MFDLLLMGENMTVTAVLAFLIASVICLSALNYYVHKDDEFNEVKQWEKFKRSFDKW